MRADSTPLFFVAQRTQKRCNLCLEVKPLAAYHRNARSDDGVHSNCKACRANYWAERRRWTDIWKRYGVTKERYMEIHDEQDGLCAICKESCALGALSVDHCHETGRVRGLLCRGCNTGLGGFRDNPGFLSAAIVYLKNSS